MGLLSFLESLFCGAKTAEINRLIEANSECEADKNVLIISLQNKMTEYTDLVQSCTAESLQLHSQIQALTALLASSIPIPDISQHITDPERYSPFNHDIGIPMGIIADEFYYAFTLPQWTEILTLIQKEMEDHALINGWMTNVSDCDDFALVMNGHAVTTFVHAGLNKQGALLFARSDSHAYNLFVAYDSLDGFVAYVYEPQTNDIIGKLGEVDWEPYVTTRGWLLGAELPPF